MFDLKELTLMFLDPTDLIINIPKGSLGLKILRSKAVFRKIIIN